MSNHSVQADSNTPNQMSRRRSVSSHILKIIYILVLLGLQQLMVVISFTIIYGNRVRPSSIIHYEVSIPVMIAVSLLSIDLFGMTHFFRKTAIDLIAASFKLTALVTLSTSTFAYFFQFFAFPRYVIALSSLLMFVAISAWSIINLHISYKVYANGKLLIIAQDEEDANKILTKAQHEFKSLHIDYIGWVPASDNGEMHQAIRRSTEVLVTSSVPDDIKTEIMLSCAENNKTVYMIPQFYELAYANYRVVQFYDTPTFMIDNIGMTFQQRLLKRIFDVLFSIVAIILTLPLQLAVVILIKLDSKGPAIYTQDRNTINGRIYKVYKFRTMIQDAEAKFGAFQSSESDPRVTRLGKFLRNSRLDELPQFYNVLKGDLSVVGPRSDRPITISAFEERIPGYNQRLKVKSGITGLAQIQGKYNTDPEDKLRFDMMYIKNYSLLLDIKIIFMTFGTFIPSSKYSTVKNKSDYQA